MQKLKINLFEWIESIVIALAFVILIYTFCFRTFNVEGPSMLNTFYDGDLVVTQCMTKSYNYNDVVVLDSVKPNQVPIIKRIIGVEGDTIDIDNETGTVIRNGVPLIEEYARTKTYTRAFGTQFPLQVEQGKLFLLGDNRDISKDSRSAEIGQVEIRDIWGKVIFNVNRKLK